MIVTFLFMPRPKGRRAVIIALGGGNSVLAADQCESKGLTLPSLPWEIRDRLGKFTPDAGNTLRNPIDTQLVWWSPEDLLSITATVDKTLGNLDGCST